MNFHYNASRTFLFLLLFSLAMPAMASKSSSTPSSKRSFFDLVAQDIHGKKVHFTQYRGNVVLVVNTASHCGFTPQLKDLEELYKRYSPKGFTVLAFPSNDFKQEKGSNNEVLQYAQKEYGVTFPIFDKGPVTGKDKQEVFKFLTEQKPGLLFKEVHWNFEKFLINRRGEVIERWTSITSPTSKSVTDKIENALNDPI